MKNGYLAGLVNLIEDKPMLLIKDLGEFQERLLLG